MTTQLTPPLTLPDPHLPFEHQHPLVLLSMCIWGESRGEGMAGKLGVGCVVRNRVGYQGKYGEGFSGVILKPFQFSSFNAKDLNRAKLLEPLDHDSVDVWQACLTAAHVVYWGSQSDTTQRAVFYHDVSLAGPPEKKDGSCAWGDVLKTLQIGKLVFYREA